MPIKFRCQHCQQLMGISRKKVGQVVDCPKCGRSVRVPIEDGVSQPAPEPEWNLEDPALAKALDELAAIGKKADGTQAPAATPAAPPAPTPPAPPAPIVPPTPPVVKVPPKPVEPEKPAPPPYTPPAPQAYTPPPRTANHQESIAGSWYIPEASESGSDDAPPAATPTPAYTAPPPSYSQPAAAPSFTPIAIPQATAATATEPTYQATPVGGLGGSSSARPSEPVSLSALAELASRPAAIPARPTRTTPVAPPAPKSTSTIVVVLVTMLATGLVGLGIAYAAGLFSSNKSQNTVDSGTPNEEVSTTADEPPVPKNVAVSGRVMYIDEDGEKRPDVGARVLLLPIERTGTVTLPSSGLGPVDGKDDFLVRLRTVREIGGDAAIVNDDGSYELRLPGSAGDFQVIAVSKFQGRDDEVSESIRKIMTEYFGEDSHILAMHACGDKRLRYNGKEKKIMDFEFPPPSP